jgi:formylglycine-generating enzyme required for sulfatase activity
MAKSTTATAIVLLTICCSSVAYADSFGNGLNVFNIEFVPIGDPNNPDDTTGFPNPAGKVEYAYRIGKYEISRDVVSLANNEGGLSITLDSMSTITGGPRDEMPATGITWFEAATFVNWLNTSTGHTPAYNFNGITFAIWEPGDVGYNPANRFRNSESFYFLPSVDEWYKAAYYDPINGVYYDYPTGSDTAPTAVASGTSADKAVYKQVIAQGPADITLAGALSPYGTMAQGGNAVEWQETEIDLVNDSISSDRGLRGGDWSFFSNFVTASSHLFADPAAESSFIGFRVASVVPEPGTMLLSAWAVAGILAWRRR